MIKTINREGVDTNLVKNIENRINMTEIPHRKQARLKRERIVAIAIVVLLLIAGAFSASTAEAFEYPPIPDMSGVSAEEKEIYTDFLTPLFDQVVEMEEEAAALSVPDLLKEITDLLDLMNKFLEQLYTDET